MILLKTPVRFLFNKMSFITNITPPIERWPYSSAESSTTKEAITKAGGLDHT